MAEDILKNFGHKSQHMQLPLADSTHIFGFPFPSLLAVVNLGWSTNIADVVAGIQRVSIACFCQLAET